MRHSIAWLFVVCIFASGCSRPGTTVVTTDGSKVSTNGATTKIENTNTKSEKVKDEVTSKEGDMTIKDAEGNTSHIGAGASDADLAIDVYPGATKDPAGGYSAETNGGKTMSFSYLTADSVEDIAKFDKGKYPEAKTSEINNDGDKMACFNHEQGKQNTIVSVTRKKADQETRIGCIVDRKN